MKRTYDEYEKYDVNKDEEFLRALANENAFAYYLIRNNQKRPYRKTGAFSNKANKNITQKLSEGITGHLARKTVKGLTSAAVTGAMIGMKPMLIHKTAQLTKNVIKKHPKTLNAVMSKSGVYRV